MEFFQSKICFNESCFICASVRNMCLIETFYFFSRKNWICTSRAKEGCKAVAVTCRITGKVDSGLHCHPPNSNLSKSKTLDYRIVKQGITARTSTRSIISKVQEEMSKEPHEVSTYI